MPFTVTNIDDFTSYWKQILPEMYGNLEDEELINLVKEQHPDMDIPEYEEMLQTAEDSPLKQEQETTSYSLENADTDPQNIAQWFLTADFIPESFKEEGFMGISPEFFREAYNNSMAGQAYKAMHGKEYWEVGEYQPEWYAQAGQFLVGMASPLELAVVLGTGAIGKGASLLARNTMFGGKVLEKGVFTSIASRYPKMGTMAQQTIEGAVSMGIGGGGFSAAHALTTNLAEQRMSLQDMDGRGIGKVNIMEAMTAASDEFLHTLPMFAATGGVTQGIMGSIYGYAGAYMTKGSLGKKLTQAVTSPAARTGSEIFMFTQMPSMLGHEDAPKFGSTDWWKALATNGIIIKGMKLGGKLVEGKNMDAYKFLANEIKLEQKLNKKTATSTKEVLNSLDSKNVPTELREAIRENILKEVGAETSLAQGKKDLDFIKDINRKLENPEYERKARTLGTPENAEVAKFSELVSIYKIGEIQTISNILGGGETRITQAYKDYYGKPPGKTELLRFTKLLETWKSDIQKSVDWHNEYYSGGWANKGSNGRQGGQIPDPSNVIPNYKTTILGKTRETAIAEGAPWKTSTIIEVAKKLDVVLDAKQLDNPVYKKAIIEDIFNAQKALDIKGLQKIEAGAPKITPGAQGQIDPSKAKLSVINEKLLETDANIMRVIKSKKQAKEKLSPTETDYLKKKSGIDIINKTADLSLDSKQLLAYSVHKSARTFEPIHTQTAINVMKFAEKRHGRSIDNLTSSELKTLARDYINDYFGDKIISDKFDRLNPGQLLKLYKGDKVKAGLVEGEFNILLNNMKEHFRHGDMQKILNYDILAPKGDGVFGQGKTIKVFQKKGQKEITIAGGIEGISKLGKFAKSQKEFKAGGKKISGEEASVLIDVANELFLRPEDIPLIKVLDIKHTTKQISVGGKGAVRQTIPLNDKTFKAVENLISKKKLKPSDNLFKVKDVKELNLLMNDVYKKAPNAITPEIYDTYTGEYYNYDITLKTPSIILSSGLKLGGTSVVKGIKSSSLFRRLAGLEGKSPEEIAGIMGHSRLGTQKRYKKAGAPKPISKEKRAERLAEETIFKTKGDDVARQKFIDKVMKKNKLSKEQLKIEGLDEGVLGEFAEGIVKLQEGAWQPSDFYHENLHRLKAFGRSTNDKKLIKLIDKAEKLAVNTKEYKAWKKKNPNRDVEEFLADIAGGKASKMEFTSGILNKVGQFLKQIISRVKVAFGVGNFKDMSNVLAKRVQKGFSTEGVEFAKGQIKYRMAEMTQEGQYKYAKNVVKDLFKEGEITKSQEGDVIRFIGEMSGFGERFKLTKDVDIGSLQQFVATINSMGKNVIRNLPNKVEKFRLFRDSERARLIKNVKEAERKQLLKDLEVKDGEIFNASEKQLKDYIEILQSMDDVKTAEVSWIDERIAHGNLDKGTGERFKLMQNAVGKNLKAILPVATVLEAIGLGKLANKLYSHTSSELGHIGAFTNFESKMKGLAGTRGWNKVKDMLYLFDKERYRERDGLGILKSSEKKFINDAFDTKTWKIKDTQNGLIVREYQKLMEYYKNELVGKYGILKRVLNAAELEKFKNDKNIKWFGKDNVYVQRRITKEFKELYDPNARHFEKLIGEQTDAISTKMAERYYKGEKNVTKEMLAKKKMELWDDANATAYGELHDMFSFNPGKYSPSFLKERHVKLPEFVKINGKKVQVYETKFGLTVKDYAIGQAKFLANVEYFPEFVKMKGFNKVGEKRLLGELKIKDKTMADWVERRLRDHLKIDKEFSDYPDGIRLVRYTTATAAKIGLSFPTSGLKNFLVGSTQSLLAYRFRDFGMSFVDAIKKDNREMVKSTGATEIGLREFEMRGMKGVIDKIASQPFKVGFMKPSENLNRYISVLAGKRDQAHLVRRIKNGKEGSGSYNKAYRRLNKFYKLNDAEIKLLKKFGMEGVQGLDAATKMANKRLIENVYQKMNTYAHINTQGAAINLFMPDWAGKPLAQSALLYKRMAYAASVNTIRNLSIAVQNKTLLRPIMFGLGAYMSGSALIALYDKIMGQPIPQENSDEWTTFKTIMWKGEFLGILSEFLNPFKAEGGIGMSMYPALTSIIGTSWNATSSMLQGEKFVSQGVNDILKASTGLYNNASKIYKQGLLNPDSYPSESKAMRKLYYEMLDEKKDRKEMQVQNTINLEIERSKYMRAFWETFESGKKEDLGKWYMMCVFAKANDYWYTKQLEDGTPITTERQAIQHAWKSMKQSVTNMNPNKAAITAKYETGRRKQKLKLLQYIDWLTGKDKVKGEKFLARLEKVEKQYNYRRRVLLPQSLEKYLKSTNLMNDLEYYGIEFRHALFNK